MSEWMRTVSVNARRRSSFKPRSSNVKMTETDSNISLCGNKSSACKQREIVSEPRSPALHSEVVSVGVGQWPRTVFDKRVLRIVVELSLPGPLT